MNFDLDDPLGDILSEGSNDSFFDSGKKTRASKPAPKPSSRQNVSATPPKESKNKMADLFGISTNDEVKPLTAPQPSSLTGSRTSESPKFKDPFELPPATHNSPMVKDIPKVVIENRKPESPAATKSSAIVDDDNDDLDFGFDLKKIKTKTGIFNDLLGVDTKPSAKKPTQTTQVIAATKPNLSPSRAKTAPSPKNVSSRQSTVETVQTDSSAFGDYAPSSTRRGGRRSSNQLNDPLGLFNDDPVPTKKDEIQRPKAKSIMAADWLGLSEEDEVKPGSKRVERVNDSAPPASLVQHVQYHQPVTTNQQNPPTMVSQVPRYDLPQMAAMTAANPYNPDLSHTTQMMNLSNREAENALYELKQQEMQIMFASQIRNQEHALMDIQNRQEDLIKQQEVQFNDLLQKQIQRQQILEENIKMQQERINAHIHLLLSQPNSKHKISTSNDIPKSSSEHGYHQESSELHVIEIESEMKRLEYDKTRLENLVANLNVNHDQEIHMLEQSYKKQIELLTLNMSNIEERFKDENKNVEEFFERKINLLQTEINRKTRDYEQRIEEINQEYDSSIKKIKSLHEIEMEDLKNDSRTMIENIRQSKLLEFSIVQENQSYLQTLKNASKYLENASGDIQNLRDSIQDKLDIDYKEKQIDLDLKEKRLNEQEKKLYQLQESNEIEKNRLLELIKNLETKLIALTQTSAEDEWNYKQKIKNLETERLAFERERQFFRDQHTREQRNLEETKKLQNADYQMKLNEIETEKFKLFNEKSKFEILARVQPNHGAHLQQQPVNRIEVETAIKVAEDAARQADQERERLMEMQRNCEIKKRELIDKEIALQDHEKKFEFEIEAIKAKERNAENAVRSAKQSEQRVIAKLQILQKHSNALTSKEANLAKEKLAISNERVELQQLRKQLYESRCSLCKLGERSQQLNDILSSNAISTPNGNEQAMKFDLEMFDVERLDRILDREVEESMMLQKNDDSYSFEVNIDNIPNIEDIDDQFLDPEILMLKLEAMNKS